MTACSMPYRWLKALPDRLAGKPRHWPIAAAALLGALAIVWATRWGPWAFSDSVEYIVSARNLLRGDGLGLIKASGAFQPLYLHPPGYPLLLAGAGMLGIDLVDAARWINVALFASLVLLAGLLVLQATDRPGLALGSSLLVLTLPTLVELYSGAMSEPAFYAAGLLGMWLLLRYLQQENWRQLFGAALAFGFATLTRYPGLAFAGAGALGILLFVRSRPARRRAVHAGLLTIVSVAPGLLWTMWIAAQPGGGTPRQWAVLGANVWQRLTPLRIELTEVLWDWIPYNSLLPPLPYHPKPRLLLAAGLLLAALLVWAVVRLARGRQLGWRRQPSAQLATLFVVYAGLTVLVLAGAFALSTPELDRSDIDRRMLSGVQLAGAILIFPLADLLLRAWPHRRWMSWAAGLIVVLGISWYLPLSFDTVSRLHRSGAGFTGAEWRNSPTIELVRSLPPDLPVITNESAAVLFLLDRPAYDLPELVRREKLRVYPRFGDGPDEEDRIFREYGAALVLFDSAWLHFYQIYEAQTDARLAALTEGLELRARTADGAMYSYPVVGD